MRIWNYETGDLPPQPAWETATADVPNQDDGESFLEGRRASPSFLFSPDGRMVAVNGWRKTIPIWETLTGKERLLLAGTGSDQLHRHDARRPDAGVVQL